MMETKLTGKIIVVGDNIDTDQIYPGAYLALTDPTEIGSHCMESALFSEVRTMTGIDLSLSSSLTLLRTS